MFWYSRWVWLVTSEWWLRCAIWFVFGIVYVTIFYFVFIVISTNEWHKAWHWLAFINWQLHILYALYVHFVVKWVRYPIRWCFNLFVYFILLFHYVFKFGKIVSFSWFITIVSFLHCCPLQPLHQRHRYHGKLSIHWWLYVLTYFPVKLLNGSVVDLVDLWVLRVNVSWQ